MSQDIINKADRFCQFVQQQFGTTDFIPLHVPRLKGREQEYVAEAIQSTFVSTVGQKVVDFEQDISRFLDIQHAVAMVNGTAALHIALLSVGVSPDSEVITQPLSFVATANAIHYANAHPVFIDINESSLSLCPEKLSDWLADNVVMQNDKAINKHSHRPISACVPMHTFGLVGDIESIVDICESYGIPVVEDAAESLGSKRNGRHAGTFGRCAAISFNGNKIMTTGGGGMLVTNDETIATMARHLSTTAKQPHKWEYVHDRVGYNYRLPNLNAALGVAQLEQLPTFLKAKRTLAEQYQRFFRDDNIEFVVEPEGCAANYWLCTLKLPDKKQRDIFLEYTNAAGVMTRPAWQLLNDLSPYQHCLCGDLTNARKWVNRLVNIPSSVI